jgi:hypothetical protein
MSRVWPNFYGYLLCGPSALIFFVFTPALCQATAKALMEGSAITTLEFNDCSFTAEGNAVMMANGLARNTSVSHVKVVSSRAHLTPVLLALVKNTGVKTVLLNGFGSMDEPLCTSMQNVLELNTTLESLELDHVLVTDDNAHLWCRALTFLPTNKVLKSLMVTLDPNVTESRASAFRINITVMLEENVSLENISILSYHTFQAEEYNALITALQKNTKLKTLRLSGHFTRGLFLSDDEDKRMVSLLQKNYALEKLPDIKYENEAGNVAAILRLNEAGRRYLVQDGSSISKGVEVLSAVSNEINCVFLHLLENPRLCDRSAVELAIDITDNTQGSRGSTSPANRNGKRNREQDQALKEDK